MSISPVSGSTFPYQAPQTPQAESDDERTESANVKITTRKSGGIYVVPVSEKSKVEAFAARMGL